MISNPPILSPGDILYRRKDPCFDHVGVYLGWGQIFQNTPNEGEHITSLAAFSQGKPYRVRNSGVPASLLNWRAQKRLLENRRYDLVKNNCEHSVFALIEGAARSPQLAGWCLLGALLVFWAARR